MSISRILDLISRAFRADDHRFAPAEARDDAAARLRIRFCIGFNA